MNTEKYIALRKRIRALKKVYLPAKFSPTGAYRDSTYEKVRAYEVLAHAEMEFYFEEIALSIAKSAYEKWSNFYKASPPLVAMVAYYSGQYPSMPESHDGNISDKDVDYRVKAAYQEYNHRIRVNNHGIKEKNILSIFLPIGVRISDLDEGMLIALNNFGSERGKIAHSTRASKITTPEDALSTVADLMSYIDLFDQFLSKYKRTI